ncbi:MAG: site-specific tyrosine recombinase/integron integrase [Actinomycetota bacterium]
MEFEKALKKYIDFLRYEKNLSPNTINSYTRDLKHFLGYLKKTGKGNVGSIELSDFRKYIKFLDNFGYSNSSLIRKYSSYVNFFRFLEKNGYMKKNLSQHILPPKKKQRFFSFLSQQETGRLLDSIQEDSDQGRRNKAIFELMYSTGARVSEIAGIRMEDLDMENSQIKVTGKGNKQRIVYINSRAADALAGYMEIRHNFLHSKRGYKKSPYLFLNKNGERLSTRSISSLVKRYVAGTQIKKDITPHSLRHSFASHMLQEGANIREIQELLGHENISTTQIYAHLNIKKIKQDYRNYHPRAK